MPEKLVLIVIIVLLRKWTPGGEDGPLVVAMRAQNECAPHGQSLTLSMEFTRLRAWQGRDIDEGEQPKVTEKRHPT